MSPNSAATPEVSTDIVLVPYVMRMLVEYSGESALRPATLPRTTLRSSSRMRIRRPLPSPSCGIDVSPGQAITMRSPRPAVDFTSCLCRPVPKASMRLIATVPHTIPKTVRNVRSFSLFTSRMSCLKTSLRVTIDLGDFFWRPLDDAIAFLQAGHDLHAQAVRNAGFDLDFLARCFWIAAGQLNGRFLSTILESHQALRNHEHVLLLADDHVGVCGVAGAECDLVGRVELDFDVEQRRTLLLLRLRRDARDAAGDDIGGQRADLDPRCHSDRELADVDLVDGPLEDEIAHVGDRGHLRTRLIGRQRNDRIAGVDRAGEDRSGGRCANDRLRPGERQPSFAREIAILLRPS